MLITDKTTIETYYKALLKKESRFIGIFFVGVKTTKVFCIATCRARKPKLENVQFYTSFKAALTAGFRPCKICKPTENANEAPGQVEQALQLIKASPKQKISDGVLKEKNISPEVVRRWFKKNYGMTFQAYQRMLRINTALEELKGGKNATHTAFDSGYESLSGFGYTFRKILGTSPRGYSGKNVILIDRLTTPLGPMFICATEKGICLLEFVDRRMLETEFKDLQKLLDARIIAGENRHMKQAKMELADYFHSKRKKFNVQLETPGTNFQKSIWQGLQRIPYGTTISYANQAELIGKPKAVRAVASANGLNRISIIIPCHRVVGKDGKLTGYGGGIERKKWLIDHERNHSSF